MKTKIVLATLMMGFGMVGAPALAQAPRPDTEFCAKARKADPGGICTPKGEYVTASKVYLPDGRVVARTTGGE
ncbi:hypothetical protein GCM10011529_26220 [Polymorphobacter glacialis]|uniref:DUF2282 domain-containing protein n=1 Tax=Sandarakinorhabdus glacialis TaxID=1614636 RepID=A0A916ZZ43_9SPHN|nr:hypothetical protein [Polymorphobacter glacialis]GGE18528.1 hypothetical protein GCM10011529_26220 [Polymorphobacter glacialis]